MTKEIFDLLLEEQVERCRQMLAYKATEYATEDRLHNFHVAAALEGITTPQAVAGMMAKHTISIYDMCASGESYPVSMWEEKITDHLNYLILLNAVVREHE